MAKKRKRSRVKGYTRVVKGKRVRVRGFMRKKTRKRKKK